MAAGHPCAWRRAGRDWRADQPVQQCGAGAAQGAAGAAAHRGHRGAPRRALVGDGARQRHRHRAGQPHARVRALLHHARRGPGPGTGAERELRDHPAPRRHPARDQRTGCLDRVRVRPGPGRRGGLTGYATMPSIPSIHPDAGTMASAGALADQPVILFVDDEPQSCKWFARTFADEFNVLTATSVDDALALLREQGSSVALLVTDYRMPQRNGLDLLLAVQHEYKHLVRLLATAYAEKEVAIAAINEGHVFRILEKPLDLAQTRLILREAMTQYRAQTLERALQENRMQSMRETLGFLAHELNTPLATVRGFVDAITGRYLPPGSPAPVNPVAPDAAGGMACFSERQPGEVMAALAGAGRSAVYCQSLVSAFVRSARDAFPGVIDRPVMVSSLVHALLKEFPFEHDERSWVSCEVIS